MNRRERLLNLLMEEKKAHLETHGDYGPCSYCTKIRELVESIRKLHEASMRPAPDIETRVDGLSLKLDNLVNRVERLAAVVEKQA